jgi:hypothetical protein
MRSASNVYTQDMADTGRCEQSAALAGRQRQWASVRRAGLWQHIGAVRAAGSICFSLLRDDEFLFGDTHCTENYKHRLVEILTKLLALAGSKCRFVRH